MSYPFAAIEHKTREVHGCSGNVTGAVGHEAVVEKADLQQVLADRPGLDMIVIRLGDTAQEVHGIGIAQVVIQRAENETFGTKNLGF